MNYISRARGKAWVQSNVERQKKVVPLCICRVMTVGGLDAARLSERQDLL